MKTERIKAMVSNQLYYIGKDGPSIDDGLTGPRPQKKDLLSDLVQGRMEEADGFRRALLFALALLEFGLICRRLFRRCSLMG